MSKSKIAEAIIQFLIKTFWPWFLENIWPLILKHIISVVTDSLDSLSNRINRFFADRMKKRSQNAAERAHEATEAAAAATTDSEREKHEAVAKVWREVAEQFRSENEALHAQVIELIARTQQSVQEDLRHTKPAIDDLAGTPSLIIGQSKAKLPALPYEQGTL
ncbi:hypothetical protein D3879_15740 [Pseudomonas cavernicola]|uniref:Uncharacterized protein n=1 Tax=Pseudomonas cavernicola TaxID=2320866 RepID=A0A418XF10_9PSED|nr:hypothetical protein [Pseudomonas cavernicola]RJG11111.1 hypothetical protein D3879_15740 [Pseudomonas cavernicola]